MSEEYVYKPNSYYLYCVNKINKRTSPDLGPASHAIVVCAVKEKSPDGLLCCPHHRGQSLLALGHGSSEPGGNTSCEKTIVPV